MEPTREELLIARVIDRGDTLADWDELDGLARADRSVWQRVWDGLRDDCLVRHATAPALSVAEHVEVAVPARARAGAMRWSGAAGWLVAAVLAVAWCAAPSSGTGPAPARTAIPGAPGARADALPAGRLPGELSRVLVKAEPTDDGRRLRVVSMRRILEESVVDQVFQFDQDELGDVRPVQVDLVAFQTPSDF